MPTSDVRARTKPMFETHVMKNPQLPVRNHNAIAVAVLSDAAKSTREQFETGQTASHNEGTSF